MPDGGDNNEPRGGATDRVTLDSGIAERIAALAASKDPIDRVFAVLLSRDPDLYELVAVEANREGQSFTGAVGRALRNRYLCELDKMITAETPELAKKRTARAVDLAAAIKRYAERNWPRDKNNPAGNPYSQYDIDGRKKWFLYEVLSRLKEGRLIHWRQLYDILQF